MRKNTLSACLAGLLAATGFLPAAAGAEDLMDIYREAVANDPVLASADARRLVVAEGVPQARAALLPQLSAGLSLQQFHPAYSNNTNSDGTPVDGGDGHSRQRDLTLNLDQTVVDLSKFARERQAKQTSEAQEATYRGELQDLYVRSTQAYFNVLVAQDQVEIFQSFEDAYQQQYNQAKVLFDKGLAPEADLTQAQAYYLYIKSQRVDLENSLKDARRALQQLTGKEPGTLKTLRDDLPMDRPAPDDASAWVKEALDQNPSVVAGTHLVSADEHSINAARSGHLPTLNLAVGYDKLGSWSNVNRGGASYGPGSTTIGLVLAVPLFSGGLTQSQVRQAIHQRDEDQSDLESSRRQAARDAYNYYNLVIAGIGQLGDARVAVDAAKKSLASLRAGYEIGTQNLTSVVVAIQILANVRSQYTSLRHQFIVNKLLLKRTVGAADLKDMEEINRLLQ
ncbi:TolC family outer membrane protein [Luteibacter aegosomaticola]|uniref:TolC family outer membrane protein n=1 Tax=Luteibacter aegosomaticola TaxID=2911538 RepID=UPI001FF906A8|nr:TolC family outer membrane protein [Luteibacter aegosomaticola]UPG90233.1 TolC family outer membrane protein [Luteibacter aegosomaticola]